MKILLVADADWVINQTRSAMTGDHELIELSDPREAERTMSDADIVLIDMQVGSMGGMALTRSLKSLALAGESSDAPIVLLLDRTADEFLAKRSGADGWLLKPFSAQDLNATLAAVAPASA